MKTLYFIGGGNLVGGELESIDKIYIKQSSRKSVFVLDLTTNNPEKLAKYRNFLRNYFVRLGIQKISFFSESDLENLKGELNNYDIIYIPGGNTKKLLENLRLHSIGKILNAYEGIIVGNSAGALVLCKNTIITKDEDNPKTIILEGLGLVDFSVEVHYDGSQDTELSQIKKNYIIYTIPEAAALIYSKGEIHAVGDVKTF